MVRKTLQQLCISASTGPSWRFADCERSCLGVTRKKIPNNQRNVWSRSSHMHFCQRDILQSSYCSCSSVPFSPPVQMRCREVKLWDRRALNSSIGSLSLSTSSGWVLHPQPSEMMRIGVWQWEDGRSRKKIYVCGMRTCGSWHEWEVRSIHSIGIPHVFVVDLAEVWHCPSAFQGKRQMWSLCLGEKKKSASERSASHVHDQRKGSGSRQHISTSLFCVAARRPLLLTFSPQFIFPITAAEGPVESGSMAQPRQDRNGTKMEWMFF